MKQKKIFSGIQPSGEIHLGNYLGAIKQWMKYQNIYDTKFCVVDLHTLTKYDNISPIIRQENILKTIALYLSCGINPNKSCIFIQSQVKEHTELSWMLNCMTSVGLLNRMTQYKGYIKSINNIEAGLFNYPVLMAADVLLYDIDYIPVGLDQIQHVELIRKIARKFNNKFGEIFKIPKAIIDQNSAQIMSLNNPKHKMSKSSNRKVIGLLDSPDIINKAFMTATTDSGSELDERRISDGVLNLIKIASAILNKEQKDIIEEFKGKTYYILKKYLSDLVINELTPIKQRYNDMIKDKSYLLNIVNKGRLNSTFVAKKNIYKVKKMMGLV